MTLTRRTLLGALAATLGTGKTATRKGPNMAWANTVTDPLIFPPGASGAGVLQIGSKLPPGMTAAGYVSGIVFPSPNGSYLAIASVGIPSILTLVSGATQSSVPYVIQQWQGNVVFNPNISTFNQLLNPFTQIQTPSLGSKFALFGGGINPPAFRITADGWVELEGIALNNSGIAAASPDTVLTGLPQPLSGLTELLPTMTGAASPILLNIQSTVLTIQAGSCPTGQNIILQGCKYYAGRVGT